MIIDNICIGSEETALHSFEITASPSAITIHEGMYYLGGSIVFMSNSNIIIDIPVDEVTELTHFQVWLTKSGIDVLMRTDREIFDDPSDPIDLLVWFSITPENHNLQNVDVNVRKIIKTEVAK